MKNREKIILIGLIAIFLIFVYFSLTVKIDRSSIFPSHDKTLIIRNSTIAT